MGKFAEFCKGGRIGALLLLSLVPDGQAVAVPVKQLDAVAALRAKDKEVSGKRIGTEEITDHLHQAVEAAAHVGRLGAQEDAYRQRQTQHGVASASRTARSCRRVAASKPTGTRRTRPAWSTSSRTGVDGTMVTGRKVGRLWPVARWS